jgi:hypothetical protein
MHSMSQVNSEHLASTPTSSKGEGLRGSDDAEREVTGKPIRLAQ